MQLMVEGTEAAHRAAAHIAHKCIAMRSRRLGRVISRLYDDALRPHGLNVSQLVLLAAIEAHAPSPAARIAASLDMEKSTFSRKLRLLLDRGWVERDASGPGRAVDLALSALGQETLVAAMPAWEQAQRTAEARLGVDASAVLDALLASDS